MSPKPKTPMRLAPQANAIATTSRKSCPQSIDVGDRRLAPVVLRVVARLCRDGARDARVQRLLELRQHRDVRVEPHLVGRREPRVALAERVVAGEHLVDDRRADRASSPAATEELLKRPSELSRPWMLCTALATPCAGLEKPHESARPELMMHDFTVVEATSRRRVEVRRVGHDLVDRRPHPERRSRRRRRRRCCRCARSSRGAGRCCGRCTRARRGRAARSSSPTSAGVRAEALALRTGESDAVPARRRWPRGPPMHRVTRRRRSSGIGRRRRGKEARVPAAAVIGARGRSTAGARSRGSCRRGLLERRQERNREREAAEPARRWRRPMRTTWFDDVTGLARSHWNVRCLNAGRLDDRLQHVDDGAAVVELGPHLLERAAVGSEVLESPERVAEVVARQAGAGLVAGIDEVHDVGGIPRPSVARRPSARRGRPRYRRAAWSRPCRRGGRAFASCGCARARRSSRSRSRGG